MLMKRQWNGIDGDEGHVLPDAFVDRVNAAGERLVVFAVMRNEALRLSAWLDHNRRIGVRLFAIVDNGSDDATTEILAAQPDVVFTRIQGGYARSNFGTDWVNEFHRRATPGTWVLYVDADECLVYRGWPDKPLADLVAAVEAKQKTATFGFLLDMYPRGPLEAAKPAPGRNLFEIAPCFDRDYRFRARPRKPWEKPNRAVEVVGGPRVRVLSSFEREVESTWVDYWLRGQIDRLLNHAPDSLVPFVVRRMPRQMPALSKVPLVLAGSGFRYANAHGGDGGAFFHENVVLCHFKFLGDFAERVKQEVGRREHFRRGAEYIMYADAFGPSGQIDLSYRRSCAFRNAEQLVELGLIRDLGAMAS